MVSSSLLKKEKEKEIICSNVRADFFSKYEDVYDIKRDTIYFLQTNCKLGDLDVIIKLYWLSLMGNFFRNPRLVIGWMASLILTFLKKNK